MQAVIEVGTVILGLVLRFGVPILVTALAIWFLRRLDERWQREAKGEVPVRQELPLFSTLRGWVFNDCTPEQREKCPAFIEALRPCWQVHRNGDGSLKRECLGCEIFKQAPVPIPILS
jgi:hypothetical protein